MADLSARRKETDDNVVYVTLGDEFVNLTPDEAEEFADHLQHVAAAARSEEENR